MSGLQRSLLAWRAEPNGHLTAVLELGFGRGCAQNGPCALVAYHLMSRGECSAFRRHPIAAAVSAHAPGIT